MVPLTLSTPELELFDGRLSQVEILDDEVLCCTVCEALDDPDGDDGICERAYEIGLYVCEVVVEDRAEGMEAAWQEAILVELRLLRLLCRRRLL